MKNLNRIVSSMLLLAVTLPTHGSMSVRDRIAAQNAASQQAAARQQSQQPNLVPQAIAPTNRKATINQGAVPSDNQDFDSRVGANSQQNTDKQRAFDKEQADAAREFNNQQKFARDSFYAKNADRGAQQAFDVKQAAVRQAFVAQKAAERQTFASKLADDRQAFANQALIDQQAGWGRGGAANGDAFMRGLEATAAATKKNREKRENQIKTSPKYAKIFDRIEDGVIDLTGLKSRVSDMTPLTTEQGTKIVATPLKNYPEFKAIAQKMTNVVNTLIIGTGLPDKKAQENVCNKVLAILSLGNDFYRYRENVARTDHVLKTNVFKDRNLTMTSDGIFNVMRAKIYAIYMDELARYIGGSDVVQGQVDWIRVNANVMQMDFLNKAYAVILYLGYCDKPEAARQLFSFIANKNSPYSGSFGDLAGRLGVKVPEPYASIVIDQNFLIGMSSIYKDSMTRQAAQMQERTMYLAASGTDYQQELVNTIKSKIIWAQQECNALNDMAKKIHNPAALTPEDREYLIRYINVDFKKLFPDAENMRPEIRKYYTDLFDGGTDVFNFNFINIIEGVRTSLARLIKECIENIATDAECGKTSGAVLQALLDFEESLVALSQAALAVHNAIMGVRNFILQEGHAGQIPAPQTYIQAPLVQGGQKQQELYSTRMPVLESYEVQR